MNDNTLIVFLCALIFGGFIVANEVGIDPSNWPNPYMEVLR